MSDFHLYDVRRSAVVASASQPLRHCRSLIIAITTVAMVLHSASAFQNNGRQGLAYYNICQSSRRIMPSQTDYCHSLRTQSSSALAVLSEPDTGMNSNIEELESLHESRQKIPSLDGNTETSGEVVGTDQKAQTPKKERPSLKAIHHKPVGELTPGNLKSLCDSIRHSQKGKSFSQSLVILERILQEINYREAMSQGLGKYSTTALLKPIHVFSMLTAMSKDIRFWKEKQLRLNKNHYRPHRNQKQQSRNKEMVSSQDIQRLVKVVTLLETNRDSDIFHPGCYTKDVPSFATMIAAEASRWEASGVDASLLFLDKVEKEEEGKDWDPRLIGAVLDALARVGRAEDAQTLLARAMGVGISKFDSRGSSNDDAPVPTSTLQLKPSKASHCYDALLRAWSKQALHLAQPEPDQSGKIRNAKKKSNKLPEAKASLAQARHILFNHLITQPELVVTNRTCTAVLQGYSGLGLGLEGEHFLLEIEALFLSPLDSCSSSAVDVACYNSVLHAYSQSQESGSVAKGERIFAAMKEQTPINVAAINAKEGALPFYVIPPMPDFISYSSMLNCYSRHNLVSKAEEVMEEICDNFKPNVACYLPIMQALERSDDKDAPERVLSLVERSEKTLSKPSRLLYTASLRCMRTHGRGDLAERVLEKFQDAYPNRAGGPDVYSYILALRAFEKTKPKSERKGAAESAKHLFDKMDRMAKEGNLPQLDVNAYNILLNCYARAGDAGRAEQLLSDLEFGISSQSGESDTSVYPNGKSYSMTIKALANSDQSDSVERALKIMYTNLGLPRCPTPLTVPRYQASRSEIESTLPLQEQVPFFVSIDNFNAMLRLFAKRGMAPEAQSLLNKMDELVVKGTMENGPDIQSYEAVLEALGRCKDNMDAPTIAEALVTRVEVKGEMGLDLQPSMLMYNLLLNCYANAGMAGKAERLLEKLDNPDKFSFGSTIKAIGNSGKNQVASLSRAESLANMGPANEIIYAHRLKLAAKWGMGELAEELIDQMETQKLNPSIIHYTAAINAWSKNTDDDASARAEALFDRMEKKFELDRAAFHGLLLNYSTRGNSGKAWRLLQRMLDTPSITPNRNTFTIAIDSYARSKSNNAGRKAEELLDEMRQLHAAGNDEVEPDEVTYASVIRCMLPPNKKKIQDLTILERIELMRTLQIERWPFEADV